MREVHFYYREDLHQAIGLVQPCMVEVIQLSAPIQELRPQLEYKINGVYDRILYNTILRNWESFRIDQNTYLRLRNDALKIWNQYFEDES